MHHGGPPLLVTVTGDLDDETAPEFCARLLCALDSGQPVRPLVGGLHPGRLPRRGTGGPQPGQHRLADLGEQPPHGGRGRHRAEHFALVPEHREACEGLASVGDHRHICRDPAGVVPRAPRPQQPQRGGEGTRQAPGTSEIRQERAPAWLTTPKPSADTQSWGREPIPFKQKRTSQLSVCSTSQTTGEPVNPPTNFRDNIPEVEGKGLQNVFSPVNNTNKTVRFLVEDCDGPYTILRGRSGRSAAPVQVGVLPIAVA